MGRVPVVLASLRAPTPGWKETIRSADAIVRGIASDWIIGPIRHEVLSGVRATDVFDRLRHHPAGFDCIAVALDDDDQAARFYNTLRSAGVAGSAVDSLTCAVASRADVPIFTEDCDFRKYASHLPIRLHELE